MRVLMVASEAAPWIKVGGLADAVGGLGRALAAAGHEVAWCLPFHRGLMSEPEGRPGAEIPLAIPLAGAQGVTLRESLVPGGRLLLVDAPDRFGGKGLYGDPSTGLDHRDSAERSAVLAWAAAAAAGGATGFRPDVVHCHDHPAALVPALLRHGPEALRPGRPIPVVLSIHNLEHQGVCDPGLAGVLGLDAGLMHPMGALEYYGRMNPLKGAIQLAERITTVSPTYAEEICRSDLGAGLDGVLSGRRGSLTGILNGVDTGIWDPATDPLIPRTYSASSLEGKAFNRRALLKEAGLEPARPATLVVGMISRLVEQKGIGLLLGCIDELLAEEIRLVVLGVGDPRFEEGLAAAAARNPGRMAFLRAFSERLAHLIEAGAGLFLMPSLYEPCGLNQMYSMRYGTVPLVRATGGLADTVFDPDEHPEKANGFVFRAPLSVELLKTVRRALRAFRNRRAWRPLMVRGMERDMSWARAAAKYEEVYRKAVSDLSGRSESGAREGAGA